MSMFGQSGVSANPITQSQLGGAGLVPLNQVIFAPYEMPRPMELPPNGMVFPDATFNKMNFPSVMTIYHGPRRPF